MSESLFTRPAKRVNEALLSFASVILKTIMAKMPSKWNPRVILGKSDSRQLGYTHFMRPQKVTFISVKQHSMVSKSNLGHYQHF